ncbi:MAG: hypothetical protein ACE5IL_07305 [Myxococcota bacterium]
MSARAQSDLDNGAELELLHATIARLRASVMATVFGLSSGTGLFVATIWLLLRGGADVGVHLGLLSNYFPGYSVTWPGAVVGFLWAAFWGAVLGWIIAWIYNRIADRRHPA